MLILNPDNEPEIVPSEQADSYLFVARLLYQLAAPGVASQFEEQFVMVMAGHEAEAIEIALQKAAKYVNSQNSENCLVQWNFIALTHINPVRQPGQGAELFFRIFEPDDAAQVKKEARLRHQLLHTSGNTLLQRSYTAENVQHP